MRGRDRSGRDGRLDIFHELVSEGDANLHFSRRRRIESGEVPTRRGSNLGRDLPLGVIPRAHRAVVEGVAVDRAGVRRALVDVSVRVPRDDVKLSLSSDHRRVRPERAIRLLADDAFERAIRRADRPRHHGEQERRPFDRGTAARHERQVRSGDGRLKLGYVRPVSAILELGRRDVHRGGVVHGPLRRVVGVAVARLARGPGEKIKDGPAGG